MQNPVCRIANVRKAYAGLRPLRLNALVVGAGERVALSGLDAGAAEVLVNLVTGASLPDEGEVFVLDRSTASISDGDAWLEWLDRFGLVSPRAVLLDAASLLQNLAMPITLEIDPVPTGVATRVRELAREAGIDDQFLERPIAGLDAAIQLRAHLIRALALDPALLILEHPTARLAPGDGASFGETVARMAGARDLATLMVSEDAAFATAASTRRLALNGATGDLTPPRKRLFGL